jgi:preprotein translocase subunit SecA
MGFADALRIGDHFKTDMARKSAELTAAGKARIKHLARDAGGLWRAERARVERVEQALAARHVYARGHDYVVMEDDTVQIVDPHTGRVTPGRSWERGLHQLIELKEGVPLTGRSNTTAKITYQRFFRRYMKLSGMTGTAQGLATEFWRVFGLRIHKIPTHRPIQRVDRAPQIYAEAAERWDVVAARASAISAQGAAVLVGTLSVESSDLVAEKLRAAGAAPLVLNALQDAEEARIVAAAGQSGTITIATSMAGRGTDIGLDPQVVKQGGLHVLVTEPSESRRVDFQLMGRAGRQGDPGRTETMLSLQDSIFETYAPGMTRALRRVMRLFRIRRLRGPVARLVLAWAQRNVERRNARLRQATLKSDRDIIKMLGFAGRGE